MTDKTSAKIERLEQNDKKRKRIFTVVIVLLIVIFLVGMVWGLSDILSTQGVYEFPTGNDAAYHLPENEDGAISLFAHMCVSANNSDKVKYRIQTTLDIPEDSISAAQGDEDAAAVIKFMRGDVLTALSAQYEGFEGQFGGETKDLPPVAVFTKADTKLAACYRGESEDDGTPVLDDNGKQKNTQNYYFKFRFPEQPLPKEGSVLYAAFSMQHVENMIEKIKAEFAGIMDITALDISCSGFAIDADMNCIEDTANYISFKRVYTVSADIVFKGDYAALGSHSVKFDFSANKEYFFSNAGVVFEQSEISLEKGDSEQIKAAVTADENITLKWESSDSSVATVDDEGYIKGKANSEKPVKITASFEYLGNKYSDSCTVYVRKPAKEICISQQELKLKIGESKQLTAEVLPEKATIKDVIWVCENEDVAVVEPDGTVYALMPGEAEIIAVSKDGYFKSVCKLTVNQ